MNIFTNFFNSALYERKIDNNSIFLFVSTLFYLITCIIRFKKQLANEEYFDKMKRIPTSYIDFLIKLISVLSYSLFLSSNFDINLFTNFDAYTLVNISFQLTLIYTIFGMFFIDYYPWFLILPLFTLSTIQLQGYNSLTIIFILSLLLSYFGLSNRPYKERTNYHRLQISVISLMILSLLLYLY